MNVIPALQEVGAVIRTMEERCDSLPSRAYFQFRSEEANL